VSLPKGRAAIGGLKVLRHGDAVSHDHQIVNERREHVDLPIEDRTAVDEQRALVAATEPGGQTAGQDRGASPVIVHGFRKTILT
jgi:hypothetical protein